MIKLTKIQVEEMFAHARQKFPQECCGLIGGRNKTLAKSVYRLTNIARNPQIEYEAAPIDLFNAQREMRLRGENLLGIYHSHPSQNDPLPSETDVSRAFYQDVFYFIIGCGKSEYVLRAFCLYENERRWERADFIVIK